MDLFYLNLEGSSLVGLLEKSKEIPVIVNLITNWSGSCLIMDLYLEDLASKMHQSVEFYRFDVHKNDMSEAQLHIEFYPHLLFLKDGKIVDQHDGLLTQKKIQRRINNAFFES